ncbi:MAG TPA: glycine oxidase ThiO [Gemmatimonadales bacterium]|nr:glycine oxidase ThiO [Gemmatimonadales bacterium]
MTERSDVLVIGGGIVGAACARALAIAGHSVTILDSGAEAGVATQASAGMLAPLAETAPEDPMVGVSVRARDLYAELTPELEEETGVKIGLWSDGVLKVAFTEADEADARSNIAWQRQQGLNSEWLPAGDLRQRCPWISPEVRGALLAPEDGALEPLALLEALLISATNHGARIVRGEHVEEIRIREDAVVGVRTASGSRDAGAVLVAAGCWSGRIGGLPRPLSVEPVRGQMLAYDWPEGQPRAIVFSGKGYVLRRGSELLAGSTMEHVGFDASVTAEGRAKVEQEAARMAPGLAGKEPRRSWAGLRPGTPDGHPIVGTDPTVSGLWYATGHGRNGILLAGFTGEIVAHLFAGTPLEYDLTPLDPGRFWSA